MTAGDRPIREYLERLAGPRTAPYGGAVAALCAAQAAALALAVARHGGGRSDTPEGSGSAPVAPSVIACERLVAESTGLMDRDIEAVDTLLAAYGLPRGTPGEEADRTRAVQDALAGAVGPQTGIVRVCAALAVALRELAGKVTPGVAADLAAAIEMTRTAIVVARGNIAADAALIDDPARREAFRGATSDATATLVVVDDLAAAVGRGAPGRPREACEERRFG